MKKGELWRITVSTGPAWTNQDNWQHGDLCVIAQENAPRNALVLRTGKRITLSRTCAEKVDAG